MLQTSKEIQKKYSDGRAPPNLPFVNSGHHEGVSSQAPGKTEAPWPCLKAFYIFITNSNKK